MMFKIDLSGDGYFNELSQTRFEHITEGRKATILVDPIDELIPIVRTTTIYKNPPIKFNQTHKSIISHIESKFNNALIESYGSSYKTMKPHTDQYLDLVKDSYIAIYSCYKNPNDSCRLLIITNKKTNESVTHRLTHNSIIYFSYDFNIHHRHKIVLDSKHDRNNEWIGITYRLSKTYINYINPHIHIANSNERKSFYNIKKLENETDEEVVSNIDFTISESDLMDYVE